MYPGAQPGVAYQVPGVREAGDVNLQPRGGLHVEDDPSLFSPRSFQAPGKKRRISDGHRQKLTRQPQGTVRLCN
jgi:hypothetical protein